MEYIHIEFFFRKISRFFVLPLASSMILESISSSIHLVTHVYTASLFEPNGNNIRAFILSTHRQQDNTRPSGPTDPVYILPTPPLHHQPPPQKKERKKIAPRITLDVSGNLVFFHYSPVFDPVILPPPLPLNLLGKINFERQNSGSDQIRCKLKKRKQAPVFRNSIFFLPKLHIIILIFDAYMIQVLLSYEFFSIFVPPPRILSGFPVHEYDTRPEPRTGNPAAVGTFCAPPPPHPNLGGFFRCGQTPLDFGSASPGLPVHTRRRSSKTVVDAPAVDP